MPDPITATVVPPVVPVTPVVVPPVVTPASPANWFDGADTATIGHLQAHGWDKKPANEVALAAIKSYREAQALIGAPPSELLRFPKPEDEEGWKKVYERLGVPLDAKDYDLSTVKNADGSAVDDDFATFIRSEAQKLHLNKVDAIAFATDLVKRRESAATAAQAETTAGLIAEKAKLAANWGANFDANHFVSKQAAAKLGVTPEQIATLEKSVGYAAVMEMFRGIGVKMGEDKYVLGGPNGSNGVMSVSEATSKRADLMSDVAWRTKYLNGDKAAQREMVALNTIISAARTNV